MTTQNIPASENKRGVDKLKDTYLHWTKTQLKELHGYLLLLEREEVDRPDSLATDIFDLTHNIKGLGGSFGYYLMTDIAASLCEYIRYVDKISEVDPAVIIAHARAMDVVLAEEIEGSGGEHGNRIIAHLQKLTDEGSNR